MIFWKTCSLSAAMLVGCSHLDDRVTISGYPDELHIELGSGGSVFVSSRRALLSARVTNGGARTVSFYDHDIRSGHFVAVYGADGVRVPTIPPPHPIVRRDQKKYHQSLEPGESYDITYSLNMFSPPLSDGSYTARTSQISSNEITFEIRKNGAD